MKESSSSSQWLRRDTGIPGSSCGKTNKNTYYRIRNSTICWGAQRHMAEVLKLRVKLAVNGKGLKKRCNKNHQNGHAIFSSMGRRPRQTRTGSETSRNQIHYGNYEQDHIRSVQLIPADANIYSLVQNDRKPPKRRTWPQWGVPTEILLLALNPHKLA